jgi:heptaprenyl diphosphate synthase
VITAGVDLPDEALAAEIAAGLEQVEDGLREAARAEHEVLTQASAHLLEAGGKRLRPMLVLLAAQFGDPSDKRIIPAAVAVELTHLATLYHDDVMDEADVRRDTPSANLRWNNTIAILTGDFLFARASQILADLGAEAIRIQAETFSRLVTGQVAETAGPRPGEDPFGHYLSVITEKTGSLIATSGRFGAMFSGASPEVIDRVSAASAALGVAYQMSDDILDVASDQVQSGKTPGTDLREGIATLPMLHAVRMAGPGDARLTELLGQGELTDAGERDEALVLLRAHPAMDRARADMRDWVAAARREISGLPDVPARSAFEAFCEYVTERGR